MELDAFSAMVTIFLPLTRYYIHQKNIDKFKNIYYVIPPNTQSRRTGFYVLGLKMRTLGLDYIEIEQHLREADYDGSRSTKNQISSVMTFQKTRDELHSFISVSYFNLDSVRYPICVIVMAIAPISDGDQLNKRVRTKYVQVDTAATEIQYIIYDLDIKVKNMSRVQLITVSGAFELTIIQFRHYL